MENPAGPARARRSERGGVRVVAQQQEERRRPQGGRGDDRLDRREGGRRRPDPAAAEVSGEVEDLRHRAPRAGAGGRHGEGRRSAVRDRPRSDAARGHRSGSARGVGGGFVPPRPDRLSALGRSVPIGRAAEIGCRREEGSVRAGQRGVEQGPAGSRAHASRATHAVEHRIDHSRPGRRHSAHPLSQSRRSDRPADVVSAWDGDGHHR